MPENSIKDLIKKSLNILKNKNNPYLEIELLLSFVIDKSREFILAHKDYKLNAQQIKKFNSLIIKLTNNEPLAYLTGEKEFYGFKFFVDKNTLIPRPETEIMIDNVVEKIKKEKKKKYIFIDIGTGSGCIILTLAKIFANKEKNFFGIDISKKALKVAKKNSKFHNLQNKIKFLNGNLLEPILKKISKTEAKLIITANLPYLTPEQFKNSPTIQKEPKLALVAGKDGLKYYRQLFRQIKNLHLPYYLICEIDPLQTDKIKNLAKKIISNSKTKTKKDLTGRDRFFVIDNNSSI